MQMCTTVHLLLTSKRHWNASLPHPARWQDKVTWRIHSRSCPARVVHVTSLWLGHLSDINAWWTSPSERLYSTDRDEWYATASGLSIKLGLECHPLCFLGCCVDVWQHLSVEAYWLSAIDVNSSIINIFYCSWLVRRTCDCYLDSEERVLLFHMTC